MGSLRANRKAQRKRYRMHDKEIRKRRSELKKEHELNTKEYVKAVNADLVEMYRNGQLKNEYGFMIWRYSELESEISILQSLVIPIVIAVYPICLNILKDEIVLIWDVIKEVPISSFKTDVRFTAILVAVVMLLGLTVWATVDFYRILASAIRGTETRILEKNEMQIIEKILIEEGVFWREDGIRCECICKDQKEMNKKTGFIGRILSSLKCFML